MPSCETQVIGARTCQNYYYTTIGLESPDLPHANWLVGTGRIYTKPVQQ